MSDLRLNISAMKIALGIAYDATVRARCVNDIERLAELDEIERQLDKARMLHVLIKREIMGPVKLTIVRNSQSDDVDTGGRI